VLVGNEAVGELSEPATLVFDDVDLCSVKKLSEISVKDGADLHRDLRLAGTLLRALGGTLDCISKAGFHSGDGATVSFSSFADNGVEALIGGDYRVLLGDSDFMKKNNVRIPKESTDQTLKLASNVSRLFFAVDGVVKLSYEIEYILKLSFMAIIEELATIDTSVAVQSYDPSINDAFLLSALEDKKVRIRAIKPGRYEGDTLLDEADSGAVAIGRTHNVIYPLYAARAVKRAKKFGLRMQILISAIGIFLAGFYAFFPEINILTPLSVTLYHGAFVVITWLYTQLIINRRTLHIRRYF
jgi:cation transport ATPase